MSPPPINIDGTDITGATIDGQDVEEITVDGQTVFTAGADIPDAADLYAAYDFSLNNGSLPVSDQSGNNRNLSNGSFSGVGVAINGLQAGDFDGTNDAINTGSTSALTTPQHVFLVFEQRSPGGSRQTFFNDQSGGGDNQILDNSAFSGTYEMFNGSGIDGGSPDTNPKILSCLFNGTSSALRINGTQVASGDTGTLDLNGISVGNRPGTSQFVDAKIGQVLVYNTDKSFNVSTIESFLGDKWGITV